MANESAKKLVKRNATIIRNALLFAGGFFFAHLAGAWYLDRSWWPTFIFLVLNIGVLGFFKISSTPKYDEAGNLANPGSDLSQKGLMDFMWDFIYVTWACQLLTVATVWAWLLMLVMPIYGVVKVIGFAKNMGGLGQSQQAEAEQPTKRSRATKDAPKVKFVRQ